MPSEIKNQDYVFKFAPVFKAASDVETTGIVRGYLSTIDLDEFDDIILPSAYEKTLPRFRIYPAMTLNHDYDNAIGTYDPIEIDSNGLHATGHISASEPGIRTKVKEGILRGFSISGVVRSATRKADEILSALSAIGKTDLVEKVQMALNNPSRSIRMITEIELYEACLCWLPANREARISLARSLASAMSNGEITHTRFTKSPIEKEGMTMPPTEVDALTKTAISTEVGLMKTDIKDHMSTIVKEHVDAKFLSLSQANTEMMKLMNEVKDKSGTFVCESDWKVFKDKVAADLAPLAEFLQTSRNRGGMLPWAIETDDLSELLTRTNITHDEAKFCEEIGADPIIVRMQTCNPKNFSEGMADGIAKWQADAQEVAMIHGLLSRTSGYRDRGGIKSLRRYKRLRETFGKIQKGVGMDTATAGEGLEWVPTVMSGEVLRRIENEAVVAALFQRATMPSASWPWPIIGAGAVGYVMPQSTTDAVTALITSSVVGTTSATFTAIKMGIFVPVASELTEDAIAGNLSIITNEIVLGAVRNLENAIINSDSTNQTAASANQDNDITTAYAIEKLFASGLRKKALTGTTTDGGATILNADMLRENRKNLGSGNAKSVQPSNIAHIMSSKSYINLLSDTRLITMDKFGAMATLLTGFLAAVDGSPVIISDYVRNTVAATGVNTSAGPNTFTTVLTVHRDSWAIGDRRMLTLKSDEHILTDSLHLVATWRGDFQPVHATAPATIAVNVLP